MSLSRAPSRLICHASPCAIPTLSRSFSTSVKRQTISAATVSYHIHHNTIYRHGPRPFHTTSTQRHEQRDIPPSSADRHMNIGTATRVLRDELPHFPQAGLTDYSIYAEDIAFTEPYRTHFHCHGRRWYKLLAATVHSALKIAFVDADLCVVGIQQRRGNQGAIDDAAKESKEDSHSEGGADDIQLVVRWIFEGTPRLSPSSPDAIRSVYEGVFVYVFDAEGLVKEHRLEAIHPSPPFVINWMAAAFGVPGRPPVATSSHLGMKYRDRS